MLEYEPRGQSAGLDDLMTSLMRRGADELLDPLRVAVVCNTGTDAALERLAETLERTVVLHRAELLDDELALAESAAEYARAALEADDDAPVDEAGSGEPAPAVEVELRL
ncbi:UDP-N-acetyl glucosamine 2-epimerase [Gordonia araii]|uniref:UDP-N-acetyl glucosamine 2-epimerase n=1 Tax=Gordonia araii TaxID=263909 RepID=UPI00031A8E84|nr:UDP-N-acetyl glucosamine 2-epimerase [Gordonia araii]NNG97969.1 hypothetical protein [Gordonia araii NBRC 100433]